MARVTVNFIDDLIALGALKDALRFLEGTGVNKMSSAHITFDTTGDKIARRVRKMRPSAVRNLFAAATRDDVISLSGGMPAVSLLPEEDIRRATLAAIESPEARAVSLQYGPTDGLAGLRAVLADMMRDLGIRVKADQVLVTTAPSRP